MAISTLYCCYVFQEPVAKCTLHDNVEERTGQVVVDGSLVTACTLGLGGGRGFPSELHLI